DLSTLFDQDRSKWDRGLLIEGERLLEQSATGVEVTEYHVEAAIAWKHTAAARVEDTDWEGIAALYDTLLTFRPSPVIALNRAIAVAQYAGPQRGLEEIGAIADAERLAAYPFYAAALGELHLRSGHPTQAREHFETALKLARNPMERRFFTQRVAACGNQ